MLQLLGNRKKTFPIFTDIFFSGNARIRGTQLRHPPPSLLLFLLLLCSQWEAYSTLPPFWKKSCSTFPLSSSFFSFGSRAWWRRKLRGRWQVVVGEEGEIRKKELFFLSRWTPTHMVFLKGAWGKEIQIFPTSYVTFPYVRVRTHNGLPFSCPTFLFIHFHLIFMRGFSMVGVRRLCVRNDRT